MVDFSPCDKPIGCMWIFKRKYFPTGSIDKYKTRLVAKDFTQKQNMDYFDIFSSATRIFSTRVLIDFASIYNLFIHQMDVKTTFLNGNLEEEMYMLQPKGCLVHR